MIEITQGIKLNESELQFEFIRASGPGGQNVNKVATAVQLRFAVHPSSLPEDVKSRLIRIAGKRATSEGIILIESKQFRTQERNRDAALQRFVDLVRRAVVKPKPRKKTRPTKASMEQRLDKKKRRGEIKRNRRGTNFE